MTADAQGRVTFLNAVAEDLTGWSADTATGRELDTVFRVVDETTHQAVENPVGKTLREGGVVGLPVNCVLLARDGSDCPIEVSAASIRDERDRVVGCVLVFRDVTSRRSAERARTRLAAIVADSDDAIVSKTLDGTILSWNASAERLYGYSASEAVGQPISLIVPPELWDEEQRILEQLRQGQRIEHYETVRVAKDGTRIDVSLTISPLRDDKGRTIGASKVARDITEQKRSYEKLRESDRRKDEFLAMLAHELRNPLAAICTGLEVMKIMENEPSRLAEVRTMMERQSQQLVTMVDDLLEISRLTRGKVELRKNRVNLAEVVESAIETARPAIDAAGHALSVGVPDEEVEVDGDPHRLAQVLSNLLNNAAKYTPDGGDIRVFLETSGDEAVVSVRDSGIGVPTSMQEKIFELFAQGAPPIDRTAPGLGVGLTLARTLVEMHGGTIEIRSEGEGKGSEFSVRLPLAKGRADQESPSSAATAVEPAVARRRVLIVDDNEDAAQMLRLVVERLGGDVRTASDGVEAVEMTAAFHPEIIFMDLGMPRMNGYDAARRIRAQSGGGNIVLVALTGWGQEEDRRRVMQTGFDHHLVKPARPEQLHALLLSLNDREHA